MCSALGAATGADALPERERQAFLDFLACLGGEPLPKPLCEWVPHVECDGSQSHIVGIGLNDNPLHMEGPSSCLDYLSALPELSYVSMIGCNISGPLHERVFAGTAMRELYLVNNRLNGAIPTFSHLNSTLEILQIQSNVLSGAVPEFQLPKLQSFRARANALSGILPQLLGVPALEMLDVQDNLLHGTIPQWRHLRKLEGMHLGGNFLSGPLPEFEMPVMTYLQCSRCGLSGPLPDFHHLPALNQLHIASNRFTGTIPDFLNCTDLEEINLCENQLSGTIPEFWKSPKLAQLQLCSNHLNGTLPILDHLRRDLRILDFSNNQLTGTLPNYFAGRFQVGTLDVGGNHLTGSFPPASSTWYCDTLSLWGNQFTGTVPRERIPWALTVLWIQGNQFSGNLSFLEAAPILKDFDGSDNPWSGGLPELGLLSQMTTFVCRNCRLHTRIPHSWSLVQHLQSVVLSGNLLRQPFPRFIHVERLDLSHNPLGVTLRDILEDLIGEVNKLAVVKLRYLNLTGSSLVGAIYPMLFQDKFGKIGVNLVELRLGNNPQLSGMLPDSMYPTSLRVIDISGTGVTGQLPEGYGFSPFLVQLLAHNTSLRALSLSTPLPRFVTPKPAAFTKRASLGYQCPELVNVVSGGSVTLDPEYHSYTLCRCSPGWFGINGQCRLCPSSCLCDGDIIQGCYPEEEAIVPCQETVTSANPCNPKNLTFWVDVLTNAISYTPRSDWCAIGHEGRCCARCSAGFFAQGRDCYACTFAWLVVLASVASFVLITCVLRFGPVADWFSRGAPERATLNQLVFHLQQIALLMETSASFGGAIQVLSITASTGGFSIFSLLAMGCLGLGLAERLYAMLASLAALILIVALCSCLSWSRALATALAMLQFAYVPATQLLFSALSCTDVRSAGPPHLNLLPDVACDDQWKRRILPPAGCLLVFAVGFPVALGRGLHAAILEVSQVDRCC